MGWGFSRAVTIDHTKVPNSDRTSFPVLFSGTYAYLATVANGGNVTDGSGFDIIFAANADGSSPLAFSCEKYDATTGAVAFWVLVPTVATASDTVIYLIYGNSSVTTEQGTPNTVWAARKALCYLSNRAGTDTSATDSTGLNSPAFISTTTGAAGKIAFGYQPNNSDAANNGNRRLNVGAMASMFDSANSVLWLSFWASLHNPTATFRSSCFFGRETQNTTPHLRAYWDNSTGKMVCIYFNQTGYASDQKNVQATTTQTADTFARWDIVLDVGTLGNSKIYKNGSPLVVTTSSTGSPLSTYNPLSASGKYAIGCDNDGTTEGLSGTIDHFSAAATAPGDDWILTEYNNQSSPSTFYTVGGEVVLSDWFPLARRLLPPRGDHPAVEQPRAGKLGALPLSVLSGSPLEGLFQARRRDLPRGDHPAVEQRPAPYPRGLYPPALLPGSPFEWLPLHRPGSEYGALTDERLGTRPAPYPRGLYPPALLPGFHRSPAARPYLPRVPRPGSPDYERRLARFTEQAHALINSLIGQNIIRLVNSNPLTYALIGGGLSAARAPTPNDDIHAGAQVASCFVDTSANQVWFCTSNAAGAATWRGPF